MADAVYQALDRMVPALEDFVVRGIFTQEEVRAIAAKRRDFEFLLRRRTARKADFLRYLEYELNLEELRRLRKGKLGLTKSTRADFSGQQLVHFIFERALRKFRGDLELWLQYLDYCQQVGAAKAHSRALAQALQIFPRQAGLWVRAASHEYFENASPPAARILMQRGLRLNGADSALLWTQYFKLELLYVNKLRGRRLALGLEPSSHTNREHDDEESEGEGAHPIDLPTLAEEQDEDDDKAAAAPTVPELEPSDPRAQSVQAVLQGAVPRVVYAAAVAARPDDLPMRLDCLATLDTLPGNEDGHFAPLAEEVLEGIERDMGPEAGAWARALHALRGAGVGAEGGGGGSKKKSKGKKRPRSEGEGEEGAWAAGLGPGPAACLAALERGVGEAAPASRRMWEYYVRGLVELLEAPDAVVAGALKRADAALGEEEGLTPEMYLQWAGACGDNGKARAVLDKAVAAHPSDPGLWAGRLRLAAGMGEEVRALWARALAAVGGAAAGMEGEAGRQRAVADMWLVYLQWLLGRVVVEGDGGDQDSDSEEDEEQAAAAVVTPGAVERALESALAGTRGLGRVEVCALWARWQGRFGLRRALRLVGGVALEDDKAEAEAAVGALAELCLATDGEEGDQDARDFYEAALAVCGSHPAAKPLWDAYEAAERAAGQHQRAHGVRWRAAQALGEQQKPQLKA